MASAQGGSEGVCRRLIRAVRVDIDRFVVGVRRWWSITTDPDFIASPASRRDLWRVLLPLPAVLTLIADHEGGAALGGSLWSLDILTIIFILGASCLPTGELWSDVVVSALHVAHVMLRSLVVDEDEEGLSLALFQVLPVFSMAAAGIHSAAVGGFLVASAAARLVLDAGWDGERFLWHFFSMSYVLLVSVMLERRIAQLVSDVNSQLYSYKALNLLSNHNGDAFSRDGGYMHLVYDTEVAPQSGPRHLGHAGGQLGGLDEEAPALLPATSVSSRSSLTDYVLSKMVPNRDGRTTGLGDYVFSRLLDAQPEGPEEGGRSPSSEVGGPRWDALHLEVPRAAAHEAPSFGDSRLSSRCPPSEGHVSHGASSGTPSQSQLRGQSPLPSPLPSAVQCGAMLQVESPHRELQGLALLHSGQPSEQEPEEMERAPLLSPGPLEQSPSRPPSEAPSHAGSQHSRAQSHVGSQISCLPSPRTPPRGAAPRQAEMQPQLTESLSQAMSPKTTLQRLGAAKVLRAVKLGGFCNVALNELFVENPEPEFMINGRETYWSYAGDYFLYKSGTTNTWGAAKAKRLCQVKEGKSNGVAHSPEGFEIWQQTTSKKAWREWDTEARKWSARPGSGVESRGKVRKKDHPTEKGVQTETSMEDKEVQVYPHDLPELF